MCKSKAGIYINELHVRFNTQGMKWDSRGFWHMHVTWYPAPLLGDDPHSRTSLMMTFLGKDTSIMYREHKGLPPGKMGSQP